MKKDTRTVTAANSKTMNAVEKLNLFASSEETENGPDFTGGTDNRFNDVKGTFILPVKKNKSKKSK